MAAKKGGSRKGSKVHPVRSAECEEAESAGQPESPSAASPQPHHLVLEGLKGDWEDSLWAVPRGTACAWVGRTKATAIWIKDSTVSEKHARFVWSDAYEQWSVEDMGSSNGSNRNGTPLREGKPQLIQAGDVLEFGPDVQVRVHTRPQIPQGITVAQLLEEELEQDIARWKAGVEKLEEKMLKDLQGLKRVGSK